MQIVEIEVIENVPQKAREIRETKLNELRKKLQEIQDRINRTPSDEDELINYFNEWAYREIYQKIRILEEN